MIFNNFESVSSEDKLKIIKSLDRVVFDYRFYPLDEQLILKKEKNRLNKKIRYTIDKFSIDALAWSDIQIYSFMEGGVMPNIGFIKENDKIKCYGGPKIEYLIIKFMKALLSE